MNSVSACLLVVEEPDVRASEDQERKVHTFSTRFRVKGPMTSTPWWKHKLVRKTTKVGAEVAKLAVHLNSSTSMLGRASVLLGAADALIGEEHPLLTEMALLPKIESTGLLNHLILDVLFESGRAAPGRSRGDQIEYILADEHSDLRVIWVATTKDYDTHPKGPWYQGGTAQEGSALIGRALWEILGSRAELDLHGSENSALRSDPLESHATSHLAEKIHAEAAAHNDRGRNRVLMLYGPPGTGKSYIARHVAHLRGGFSLRHEPHHWSRSNLTPLMGLMRPKTLIIDDVDRSSTTELPHIIEHVRGLCPLTIVSANYPDLLDPALRRPGRFDESIHVTSLDPNVVIGMVSDADDATKQRLLAIPVAYVEEYQACLEAFGPQRAEERLVELESLAANIEKAKPQPNPFSRPQTTN